MPKLPKVADGKLFVVRGATLNGLIAAANKIDGIKIQPPDFGSITPSEEGVVLDFGLQLARIEEVEAEVSTLTSTVASLESALSIEVSTRASADTSLSSRIAAEESTRAAADTSLTSRLNGASITGSATCNNDGTIDINVTLNI